MGASHTPGTFLGFALLEAAGIVISTVMLGNGVFGRAAGYAGLLGFGLLLLFEFASSFSVELSTATLLLAMIGGLAGIAWYLLSARGFWQLARQPEEARRAAIR